MKLNMMKHTLNLNINRNFILIVFLMFIGNFAAFSSETSGYVCEIVSVSRNGPYVGKGFIYFEHKDIKSKDFEKFIFAIDSSSNDDLTTYSCCKIGDMEEGHEMYFIDSIKLSKTYSIDYSFLKSQEDFQFVIKGKSRQYLLKFWSVNSLNCICKSKFSYLSGLSLNFEKTSNKYNVVVFKKLNPSNNDGLSNECIYRRFRKLIKRQVIR